MAVSTSSWFSSGAAVGVPQVAGEFNKFDLHKTPQFRIGHKIEDADGNVYRYAHFGADTNRGVLVSQDVSESSLGDSDNVIVASASCTDITDGTIGSRYLCITAGDSGLEITADEFAGGKFITSDDAGEGYTYDIVGNTANATGGSSFRLQLRQPLQVAVTAATDFIIVGNRYANLEIATSGTDAILAGVTCSTMDVSEQAYGWIQTKGIVGVLTASADVIGETISLSATSGAVACNSVLNGAYPLCASVDQIIGSCVVPGDASGHGAYFINLE